MLARAIHGLLEEVSSQGDGIMPVDPWKNLKSLNTPVRRWNRRGHKRDEPFPPRILLPSALTLVVAYKAQGLSGRGACDSVVDENGQ